jgi:hypothetical protein
MGWKKNNVTPLSNRTLKEMRFIMDGILEGRLEHNQKVWHCGTAHCFMGWAMVFIKSALLNRKSIFTTSLRRDVQGVCSLGFGYSYMDDLITDRWGITWDEWRNMSKATNSKATLDRMVKKFESGYRYTRSY